MKFLAEVEKTLQRRLGRGDDFVLSDYFDLIGGTSVGALIATLVARGERVSAIEARFKSLAGQIFRTRTRAFVAGVERWTGWRPDWLMSGRDNVRLFLSQDKYRAAELEKILAGIVGDEPMATDTLKTGLAIICKRADTNSVWIITNNPAAAYADDKLNDDGTVRIGNAFYKLADVLRASTAAPTYFRPVHIDIHDAGDNAVVETAPAAFIDGGVSPHNNPALQLLLMAALPNYRLGGVDGAGDGRGLAWPLGPENLLIVSVGTGAFELPVPQGRWTHLGLKAASALQGVIKDGEQMGLGVLQALSEPGSPWTIDRVMGDLRGVRVNDFDVLSFQRYDVPLDAKWLIEGKASAGVGQGPNMRLARGRYDGNLAKDVAALQRIDAPDMVSRLGMIAMAAARDQVCASHFPAAFDRVWRDQGPARSGGEGSEGA